MTPSRHNLQGRKVSKTGMYHRPSVLLLGLLWPVAPALAQSQSQPQPSPQRIAYRRDIPQNVAHAIPRRAKRLFWGTLTPQQGAPAIGLQLYQSNGSMTLELWQKKASRFVRINRAPDIYDESAPASAKFNALLYWADITLKKTPVLVITQKTSGSDNLMGGDYFISKVIALPAGWSDQPSIQTFTEGNSNSGVESFSIDYTPSGQLELSTLFVDMNGSTTTTYVWDGKEFSLDPARSKNEPRPEP